MSPVMSSIWVLVVLASRKGANAAALFVLAAALGASGLGAYSFVISTLTVLSVLSLFGFERLAARELARYLAVDDYPRARGFFVFGLKIVAGASIACAVVGVSIVFAFDDKFEQDIPAALMFGLAFVPAMALLTFSKGVLRGLQRAVLSHVGESLVRPFALIGLIGIVYLAGTRWDTFVAVGCFSVATALALMFAVVATSRNFPDGFWRSTSVTEPRIWLRSAASFSVNSLFTALNGEALVIILGLLSTNTETGAFKLASNLSGLISFVLIAINVPLGPAVARQLALGEKEELQQTVTSLARVGLLLATPMALACWLVGDRLLGLFGPQFVSAYPALAILALVQLALVAMGSVASVLVNAGYENLATKSITIGTVLNIGSAGFLVPFAGATGAAISFAIGGFVSNALMMRYALNCTGINTSAFKLSGFAFTFRPGAQRAKK